MQGQKLTKGPLTVQKHDHYTTQMDQTFRSKFSSVDVNQMTVDATKLSLQDGLALAYQDFLKFR